MQWENPRYAFPKANQYAFLFENAHLMLFSWDRDDAKFLFLIREQREDGLVLDYPGETFTQRVLDTVQSIFFVQVQEEGGEPQRYVLGSYFVAGQQAYGAYYPAEGHSGSEVVLFRVEGEAPDLHLEVPEDDEYEVAARAFAEQHHDFMEVQGANR